MKNGDVLLGKSFFKLFINQISHMGYREISIKLNIGNYKILGLKIVYYLYIINRFISSCTQVTK